MRFIFLMLGLCCYFVALSQKSVLYDRSEDLDFSQFKTYKILDVDVEYPPEFEPRKKGLELLLNAIGNEMKQRGYTEDDADPDLIINVGVIIKEEQQTRETNIRDAPVYMGQRNYQWQSEEVVVRTYNEGTVVLDVIHGADSELIWQAFIKQALSEKRKTNQKKIDKIVDRLFKKFPLAKEV